MAFAKGWGRSGESVFTGTEVQFGRMRKFWRCGGDGGTTLWMDLMLPDDTLRHG